jgi:acetolactate synthase-1/2/3 large subunit
VKTLTARQVVAFLETQGVETIFGIPGGHTLSLNDALVDSAIRFVATRHEYGAASAAAAWGRLRRHPGVCLATCGPGATNLATGLAAALRDSNPMLALTVNNTMRDMGWEDAQHADAVAVLGPVTKWSYQIRHPDEVSAAIAEAFRVSLSGKPGPVHLDFARDLLEKGETEFSGPAATRVPPAQRTLPDPAAVSRALERIAEARRPVVWAGNGVRCADASGALLAFAERFGCAVLTTFNGIGVVPTTHDNVFGARSRVGSSLGNAILAEADLVIAVGNSLNGVSTSRWGLALPPLVQIDIEPTRIGRRYPVEAPVAGDATSVLEALGRGEPGPLRAGRDTWLGSLRERRQAWRREAFAVASPPGGPVAPQELVAALDAFGRDDTVWCVDASNCGIWTHLLTIRDRMEYMRPVNFSNMGFALPAGIGAKLADPQRDVVVFAGDGGLGMTMTEIETASRLGLSLPIIVMNDSGYGNIRQEQAHKYGPRYNGVDLGDIAFHEIARAMGGGGVRVSSASGLAGALHEARAFRGPFVVDVTVDPTASVWDHPF